MPRDEQRMRFFFQGAHLNSVAGPETASDLPGCDCFNLNDTQKLLFYCKFITRANEVRFRKQFKKLSEVKLLQSQDTKTCIHFHDNIVNGFSRVSSRVSHGSLDRRGELSHTHQLMKTLRARLNARRSKSSFTERENIFKTSFLRALNQSRHWPAATPPINSSSSPIIVSKFTHLRQPKICGGERYLFM